MVVHVMSKDALEDVGWRVCLGGGWGGPMVGWGSVGWGGIS